MNMRLGNESAGNDGVDVMVTKETKESDSEEAIRCDIKKSNYSDNEDIEKSSKMRVVRETNEKSDLFSGSE